MTRNLLTILVLMALAPAAFAQGGFKQSYLFPEVNNHGNFASKSAIESPGGQFLAIGLTSDSTVNLYRNVTVLGTDAQGNKVWVKHHSFRKVLFLDFRYVQSACVAKDQSAFYHVATAKDSSNKVFGMLIKFSYNGDTLWCKRFYSTGSGAYLWLTNVLKMQDNGLLLSGGDQHGTVHMKTDLAGNELWRKTLLSAGTTLLAPQLLVSKVVQDAASKRIFSLLTPTPVVISDSLGNYLSQVSFTSAVGYKSLNDLIQTQDQTLLAAGTENAQVSLPGQNGTSILIKFDMSGAVIWTRQYGSCMYDQKAASVCEKSNGQLFIALSGYCPPPNGPTGTMMKIKKLDKDGVVLGNRDIDDFNDNVIERVVTMLPTADGGFVIAKRGYSNIGVPYMMIKTDSTGCEGAAAYCLAVGINEEPAALKGISINISPNPANNLVNIHLDAPGFKQAAIKITDAVGREVAVLSAGDSPDIAVNTTSYATGVYFIQVMYEQRTLATKRLLIVK